MIQSSSPRSTGPSIFPPVSVNIPEIDEGAEITVYFVYSGFSDALDGPCGVYAYHE